MEQFILYEYSFLIKQETSFFADGIILASSYDDLDCDTKAPQGDVDIEFSWEGNEITVSCEDDESGCTNSYSYVYSSNATCDSGFMANNYVDQPLNKSTTTTFCYKVYDKANNVDNGTAFLRYDAQCFNMIQDPDENGVDCGGPCIANCGTCNNNQLDPFEEEIDCGGVCATFRICGIPTNPPDPDPDLDPDPNPDNDASSRGCVNDYDCIEGYECSYGECEEKTTTTTTTTTTTEEEKSYLALILILIGILLIIGGIIYIYYSRKKKKNKNNFNNKQSIDNNN